MASINYATREISCKIVYYGPGLSGKTTNLQIIHRKIPDKDKSEMVSLATETDRTLFFDFLPLDLGSIKGFNTKFQLYTVPGQVYYNATRKLVLRGVDGVVFVVDSQVDKLQENLESFANLQENLREYGHSIENIPLVLQYNKRDLPNVYPIEQLNSLVNKHKLPYYEAVAATGVGVFTTLKAIGKSVIDKFNAKYAGFQGTRRPVRPENPAPAAAPKPPAPPAFGQAPAQPGQPGFGSPGFGAPPQGGPGGGQPFPARPAAPGPQVPLAPRAPLNVPQSPSGFSGPPGGFGSPGAPAFGGFPSAPANPFGNPGGPPSSAGFPGPAQQPAPITGPVPSGGPGMPPSGFPATPQGFGRGAANPFAALGGGSGNPGLPPGSGASGQGPAAFPFPQNKPGFPAENKPPMGGPGPIPGMPQQLGNTGFNAPAGIPVSPFVETFAGLKAGPANPPLGIPGMPPPPINPFGSGAGGPSSFGSKPGSPLGAAPMGGGFPAAFPGAPGNPPGAQNPLQGGPGAPGGFGGASAGFGAPGSGFGGPPAGFGNQPSSGFGAPNPLPGPSGFGSAGFGVGQGPGGQGPGGFGPSSNPLGNPGSAYPLAPGKSGPPYPTLSSPGPEPRGVDAPPSGKSIGNMEDNSGIVTTYEDMAKDDSFKTKKLPHPSEKKKGFFDGLFKKEK